MQTPGTYISAVAHIGLIGWLILGWGLSSEPLRFDAMDVSVVTGEEYEALTRAARTPVPGQAEPETPVPPEIDVTPPPPLAAQEPPAPAPQPDPVTQPTDETPPPPAPPAPPVADVTDVPPIAPASPSPPPAPDVTVSPRPTPRQAPTVASTISEPSPPDAQVDDIVRQEAVPDQSTAAEVVEQEQDATAPEETTTEIVIADETPSGAVETSMRPSSRPNRPAPPAPAPQERPAPQVVETEPQPVVPQDDIDSLLADLGAQASPPSAPAVAAGPPMTGAERDGFRVSVNRCWNVDPGSVAARVTVEVGFSLDRAGKVEGDVRLLGSDGDQSATNTAYEAARRAILRCQSSGYQLPPEKYDQWKDVVITFDPSGMRLR
ncbi:energy transducer TonB [Yoonia sp.]|uniref:energy transducer TonB n=1 Tax=Yoonia sp. TaxID=2212373 RepID=UPI003F6C2616